MIKTVTHPPRPRAPPRRLIFKRALFRTVARLGLSGARVYLEDAGHVRPRPSPPRPRP